MFYIYSLLNKFSCNSWVLEGVGEESPRIEMLLLLWCVMLLTATITCSGESTDGTFSVVCGQRNQRLYHVCLSLIFSVVVNLVPFAECHCDLNLITETLLICVDMIYLRSL